MKKYYNSVQTNHLQISRFNFKRMSQQFYWLFENPSCSFTNNLSWYSMVQWYKKPF